ncbi:MAG: TOBE domain-containing protein, partial [Alphaproteobacteria bacterium]|nr:TOBE domain-containing protein [Alphaproteobacteria bacterium]
IMNGGKIIQVGTPGQVYEYPETRFTADFIGSVNLLDDVKIISRTAGLMRVKSMQLKSEFDIIATSWAAIGNNISLAIRPEKLFISEKKTNNTIAEATVVARSYQGNFTFYDLKLSSGYYLRTSEQNPTRLKGDDYAHDIGTKLFVWTQPENFIALKS